MNQVPFRVIILHGKTGLKCDSLGFLTLITKLHGAIHFRVVHRGAHAVHALGVCVLPTTDSDEKQES